MSLQRVHRGNQDMVKQRSTSNRRSAWKRFKRFVLLRPWVLNLAFAIGRILVDWTVK